MTAEELKAGYELAARPYLETSGSVGWAQYIGMKSWRYVLEISSVCNLHCALCHAGNREGYEYHPGIMDQDLFLRILDKIQRENPQATVCCYVNSEPMLHPHLPECVKAIKARGLRCEVATNLNIMRRVEDLLAAQPDMLTVSVSGFTQPVYEKSHRGGNIEVVKGNLQELARQYREGGYKFIFAVSYHRYKYNLHELETMRQFANALGMGFIVSCGRCITMENTIQALRQLEKEKTGKVDPYEVVGDLDLNVMLPQATPDFIQFMQENLIFRPEQAVDLYSRWPVAPVCLISEVFTEIRHDGRVQLCAWTDDMRFTLGHYLDMSIEQIAKARLGHPLCRECLKRRLNLYFHIVDAPAWG